MPSEVQKSFVDRPRHRSGVGRRGGLDCGLDPSSASYVRFWAWPEEKHAFDHLKKFLLTQ